MQQYQSDLSLGEVSENKYEFVRISKHNFLSARL